MSGSIKPSSSRLSARSDWSAIRLVRPSRGLSSEADIGLFSFGLFAHQEQDVGDHRAAVGVAVGVLAQGAVEVLGRDQIVRGVVAQAVMLAALAPERAAPDD